MQVRFADSRPTGDYALVIPVAGKDRSSLSSLGPAQSTVAAALDRQRFEGDAASAAEQFVDDGGTLRRVVVIGTGGGAQIEPQPDFIQRITRGIAVCDALDAGDCFGLRVEAHTHAIGGHLRGLALTDLAPTRT